MITLINTETNLRANDRVLKLKVIDDKKPKSSTGLVDTRLFTGGTDLHCTMDNQNQLWSFRYNTNAPLPEALQGRFTTFGKAYDHAAAYFEKRNIRIAEVKD